MAYSSVVVPTQGGSLSLRVTTPGSDGTQAFLNAQEVGGQPVGPTNPVPIMDTGTAATGVAPPAGATGLIGWLSAIVALLSTYLQVKLFNGSAVVSASNPLPVASRSAQNLTMTMVVLPAGVSTLVSLLNVNRKSLQIMNIGTGFATVHSFPNVGTGGVPSAPGQASSTGNAVTAGIGYPLEVASAAGHQGGSTPIWDGAATTVDEFDAISAAGTTLLIIEGN